MKIPAPIKRGEAITADFLNGLRSGVVANRVRGDGSIEARQTGRGVLLSLAGKVEWAIEVIVVRETGGAAPAFPSDVKYRVQGPNGIDERNVVPTFGRPVHEDEARIWPQPDGTPAVLVRWNDNEGERQWGLCILDEKAAVRLCTGGQQARAPQGDRIRVPVPAGGESGDGDCGCGGAAPAPPPELA